MPRSQYVYLAIDAGNYDTPVIGVFTVKHELIRNSGHLRAAASGVVYVETRKDGSVKVEAHRSETLEELIERNGRR